MQARSCSLASPTTIRATDVSDAVAHNPRAPVLIDLDDSDAMRLWLTVARVARTFGDDRRWCLVGGLMVALFAIEAQQAQRATTDIDILTDARARPSGTRWATELLQSVGALMQEATGVDRDRGFRFDLDGQVVEVLAPDGLGAKGAVTHGKLRTIQVPGGTQALQRIETVEILVAGQAATVRRPTLIAAILLKARALRVHPRPEDQRHDLITLLSLLSDPRAACAEITRKEVRWLHAIAGQLAIDDVDLADSFTAVQLRTARASYRLLVA